MWVPFLTVVFGSLFLLYSLCIADVLRGVLWPQAARWGIVEKQAELTVLWLALIVSHYVGMRWWVLPFLAGPVLFIMGRGVTSLVVVLLSCWVAKRVGLSGTLLTEAVSKLWDWLEWLTPLAFLYAAVYAFMGHGPAVVVVTLDVWISSSERLSGWLRKASDLAAKPWDWHERFTPRFLRFWFLYVVLCSILYPGLAVWVVMLVVGISSSQLLSGRLREALGKLWIGLTWLVPRVLLLASFYVVFTAMEKMEFKPRRSE